MRRKPRYLVLSAALSAVIAFASAASLVGHPARLVAIVTLFASAFAAGLSVGMSVTEAKAQARRPSDEPTAPGTE